MPGHDLIKKTESGLYMRWNLLNGIALFGIVSFFACMCIGFLQMPNEWRHGVLEGIESMETRQDEKFYKIKKEIDLIRLMLNQNPKRIVQ